MIKTTAELINQLFDGSDQKIKVLIVDDTPFNIEALMSMFQEITNFELHSTFNGQMAIDTVEKLYIDKNQRFHIIFMDVNMPVIDGLKAT